MATETTDCDVAVIGAGPGGYVAAIRCAQLGLRTVCIDAGMGPTGKPAPGGVCLNVGCIPSKALLDSSWLYHQIAHQSAAHGISVDNPSIDIATMMERKNRVVTGLTEGISLLFHKNKIRHIEGRAMLVGEQRLEVTTTTGVSELRARHVIIASGSSPAAIADIPFDGKSVVDSTGALAFETVPERLAVIGGGVIGLELGSVWSRLGSRVMVLNRGDDFLRAADQQVSKILHRELTQQGLDIRLGARPLKVERTRGVLTLVYQDATGEHREAVDKVLVAVGRTPNSASVAAPAVGLRIDDRGFIVVDQHCRTNVPDVYAIGDVVRGPMLAHKASEEGVAVAEHIAGHKTAVNHHTIPWVIYTHPEVAWVGKTEQQLQAEGRAIAVGVFPFAASGRAHARGEQQGMIKVISDAATDQILGVHMIGSMVSELIAEAVLALEYSASSEDLARTIHAHPTFSEALHEAALAVGKRAINI